VHARRARQRAQQPHQLDRRVHLEALDEARREVVDLEAAVGRFDLGAQHVGVPHVARAGAPVLDRAERPHAAALAIEQAAEHRRAVEARQAQPVDAGVGTDQGQHAPVADHPVMQRNRLEGSGHSTRRAARDAARHADG
jgi:hypothetical protein